jgi:glycosyltransferase involved in cell wall biosynthesis
MLLSAYLITYNEKNKIEDVLLALKGVDEIVVVDSGSTDGTIEIAERLGAKVIHQPFLGYAKQKAFAMSLCAGEWVLSVDGDEVLMPGSIDEIKKIITKTEKNGFKLPRYEVFMGKCFKYAKPHYFLRLYRKDKARWDEDRLVHEHIDVEGKIDKIKIPMIHYGAADIEIFMQKINRYSSLKVTQTPDRRVNFISVLFYGLFYFLSYYFLSRYFTGGIKGFIYSCFQGWYGFLTQVKRYD